MPSLEEIAEQIETAASANDPSALSASCAALVERLPREPGTIADSLARRILKALRSNRRFQHLREVSHAIIDDGSDDPQVYRQYAQSLIEAGETTSAIRILESVVTRKTISEAEWADAQGVLGRAWKDKAVKARGKRKDLSAAATKRAFKSYLAPFRRNPNFVYQGINQIALAHWDGGSALPKNALTNAKRDAAKILEQIEGNQYRSHWDIATAGEALIALGEFEHSKGWFKDYVNHPDIDAFSLAGTLRQLRELWRLGDTDDGNQIIMPLQARLLELPGGSFTVPNADLQKLADVPKASYEKILGNTGAKTYSWMKRGFDIARSVALVRQNGRGVGTGFVVRGSDFHAALGDALFVLTNSHVVSDPPAHDAASPDQVTITFEILAKEGDEHQRDVTDYEVSEIVWQSPPEMHDAALLRLKPDIPNMIKPINFAANLPTLDDNDRQRVYIIGHPRGGEISFSYEDNELLDYETELARSVDDPTPCRIHYRAPTEPGSSGSPVFNVDWRSIGLHHKGGTAMPKLNGKPGLYGANEAISIGSIKKAIAKLNALKGEN